MSFIGAPPGHRAGVRPGFAAVTAVAEDGVTRLADLAQAAPLRLLFPHVPEGEPLTACLTNTGGGVVGGDLLTIEARAAAGAKLMVVAQAAEKIYRSAGPTSRIGIALAAERGAWLEWLPQETILFDKARFARATKIEVDEGAKLLAGEILVFGRTARGESLTQGLVRDAIEVRRAGRLIWADAMHLDGDLAKTLAHPAGFGGAIASALLVYHGPDAAGLRDALREIEAPEGVRFGATLVAGLLLARWLGKDAQQLRRHYASAWILLRSQAGGLAARLPPLWHI